MKRTVKERLADLASATPVSLERLTEALHDPSPNVRCNAVQIVAETELNAVLPIMDELLCDADEKVRIEALACFQSFQNVPRSSLDKMHSLLQDKSFLVRIEALECLAYLGDHRALPAIASLLSDISPLVRAYAARSIAALEGGTSYVQQLNDILGSEKHDSARAGILEALFLLGEQKAFTPFLQLLSSTDYRVRCGIANSLAEIHLNQDQLVAAISALVQAGQHAIAKADKLTVMRTLDALRKTD